jgi:hypothetical protein
VTATVVDLLSLPLDPFCAAPQIHLMPREFHGLVGIMEQSAKLAEEAGAGREAAAAAAAVAADKKDGPRPR